MPLDWITSLAPTSFINRRFGSRSARFKTAVTLGFLIATVGVVSTGPGAQVLFAEDSAWGSLASLFGQPFERTISNPPPLEQARRSPLLHRVAHRRYHGASARADAPSGHEGGRSPYRGAAFRADAPSGHEGGRSPYRGAAFHADAPSVRDSSGRSLCVRLCDGYVFPVGTYHGEGDKVSHQAACQATCPDAATALYVMPPGADKIDEAVQAGTNRPYSKLPDAFHYTTVLDDACTCHRAGSRGILSLLRDFTLRRGDAVMTGKGVTVFHGGGHFPFRRNDFVALSASGDVRQADRAMFGAMERANLIRPFEPRSASDPKLATPKPDAKPARSASLSLRPQPNRD